VNVILNDEPLVWLIVTILVPIVPALILFWALPSAGEAEGTFQGMRLKFGGAFAGYFGIFVLLLFYGKAPAPQWEAWEVRGEVKFDNSSDAPALNSIQVFLEPAPILVNPDGSFDADILVKPGPGGTPVFPYLRVDGPPAPPGQPPPYGSETIDLSGAKPQIGEVYDVRPDSGKRLIDIQGPIVLQRLTSAYAGGTPVPVSGMPGPASTASPGIEASAGSSTGSKGQ